MANDKGPPEDKQYKNMGMLMEEWGDQTWDHD